MNPQNDPFAKWKKNSLEEKKNLQSEDPFSKWRTSKQEEVAEKNEKSLLNDVVIKSLKEIPQSLEGQIALGLLQAATAPLDLIKLYLTGEGLAGLEEAQEASERMGIPFDMEAERQKFLSAMEYLPTQQLAEEFLEKQTGISTKPKDKFSAAMRGLAELTALTPKGTKTPKLQPKSLSAEGQSLRETAEQFNLRKFAGMEAEKAPSIIPIVSAEKEAQLASEFGESSKKAIEGIIDQKVPIKTMRDKGINLENAYETAYSAAHETAKKMRKTNIDFSNVIDWINKEIKKVGGSSPSLSNSQKAYIGVLKKERSNLTKKIPTKENSILYGPSGEILTKPGKAKIVQKKMNADQALNQYKGFNDNVKGIWRKPEFAGSENAVKNAYAGLNEQLINAIDKANPQLGKELKFANKVFHETSKLQQVESILSKSFKEGYNPKRLARTLSNKRERAFLQRNLGKDGIQDLERIAKYGQEAEKKVFSQLQNPKTMGQFISEMSPLKFGLLTLKHGLNIPFKGLPAGFDISKGIIRRIQGHLFTRNATKKAYLNYLKEAAKSPASASFKKANLDLSKSIADEFGSEEELIDMAKIKD